MIGAEQHPQKELWLWDDTIIDVDRQIAPLIALMNRPGMTTFNSCQGGDDRVWESLGYVQFSGPLAKPFMFGLLSEMLRLRSLTREITFGATKNFSFPGSCVIRWMPCDYFKVLRHARKILTGLNPNG